MIIMLMRFYLHRDFRFSPIESNLILDKKVYLSQKNLIRFLKKKKTYLEFRNCQNQAKQEKIKQQVFGKKLFLFIFLN